MWCLGLGTSIKHRVANEIPRISPSTVNWLNLLQHVVMNSFPEKIPRKITPPRASDWNPLEVSGANLDESSDLPPAVKHAGIRWVSQSSLRSKSQSASIEWSLFTFTASNWLENANDSLQLTVWKCVTTTRLHGPLWAGQTWNLDIQEPVRTSGEFSNPKFRQKRTQ